MTHERLTDQILLVPSPTRFSSHRTSHSTCDHGATIQYHSGDDISIEYESENEFGSDEADDDAISDSSAGESIEDPVLDGELLQNKVTQLQQELSEIRERLNLAKTELAMEQSKHPSLYDDFYFERQLDGLRGKVRRWTITYFETTAAYWTPPAERKFKPLSDEWAAYMEDDTRRPWLIQAQVWYFLQQRLLDPDSPRRPSWLFAGLKQKVSIDRMFAQGPILPFFHNHERLTVTATRQSSRRSRMAYRKWRASTFTLLYPGKGADIDPGPWMQDELDDRVTQIVRDIWRSTRKYSKPRMSRQDISESKSLLREIAFAAFYLALDVEKHDAEMSFAYDSCRVGSQFNADLMEEVIERKGKGQVRLIASPPLYREISSDDITSRKKLVKAAQVCSSVLERLPRGGLKKVISPLYTTEADPIDTGQPRRNHSQQFISRTNDRLPSRGSRSSGRIPNQ